MANIVTGDRHEWRVNEVRGEQLASYLAEIDYQGFEFLAIVPRGLDNCYQVVSKRMKPPTEYNVEDL